jgi:hypothetical protein
MTLTSDEKLQNQYQLIRKACENGWQSGRGWKSSVRKYFQQEPWASSDTIEEILEIVNEIPCIPKAWRFRIEGKKEGWGTDRVLVLELLEVEVSNPVSDNKLDWYEHLWWAMDSSAMLHLRVFRMDRFGYVLPLNTEHTALELVSRNYSNSVEYKELNID